MALAIEIHYLSGPALETPCSTGTRPSAAGRGGFRVASHIGTDPYRGAFDDLPALRRLVEATGFAPAERPIQKVG